MADRSAYWKEYYRKNKERKLANARALAEKRRAAGLPPRINYSIMNPIFRRFIRKGCTGPEALAILTALYERQPQLRDKDAEYLARLGYPPEPLVYHFPVRLVREPEIEKNAGLKRRRSASAQQPRATES